MSVIFLKHELYNQLLLLLTLCQKLYHGERLNIIRYMDLSFRFHCFLSMALYDLQLINEVVFIPVIQQVVA